MESKMAADAAAAAGAEKIPPVYKLQFFHFLGFYWYFLRTHPVYFATYVACIFMAVFIITILAQDFILIIHNQTINENINVFKYSYFTLQSGEKYNPFEMQDTTLTDIQLTNPEMHSSLTSPPRVRRRTSTEFENIYGNSHSQSTQHKLLLPPSPRKPRGRLLNALHLFFLDKKKEYENMTIPNEVALLKEDEEMDEFSQRALQHMTPEAAKLAPLCVLYHGGSFLKD